MTLRMQIVFDVLDSAKANNDATVVQACRVLINANRVGRWNTAAWTVVKAFA